MLQAYRSLRDIELTFPDQGTCLDYLEKIRWNGNVTSPFTGSHQIRKVAKNTYECKDSGKRFTVLNNTIFAHSKMGLRHWFKVIWFFIFQPGISTLKVSERTGINQKTVWLMKQKLDRTDAFSLEHE